MIGKWAVTCDLYGVFCGEITEIVTEECRDRMIVNYKIGSRLFHKAKVFNIETKEECEKIVAEHKELIKKERGL